MGWLRLSKNNKPFWEAPWENSQNPPENSQNQPGNSQNQQIWSKIEPERAPEMMQKHRKSLPNGRQQEPQGGGAEGAALLSSIW